MYALIDGNNFYVACERAFDPRLQGRAVVVLSNNDGCVISRSEEAKAQGIAMGQPFYQLAQRSDLVARSANFALYGDMSTRMMRLAAALGPRQEIYSIDECFIGDLAGIPHLTQRARILRQRIKQCLGIDCGIGIGPTKTLAKLCNHIAKSAERQPQAFAKYALPLAQICHWQEMPPAVQQALLRDLPANAVWGIGRNLGQRLARVHCQSAWDLQQLPATQARKLGGVTLERTVRELQGIPCLSMEQAPCAPQQIAYTRSFGQPVLELPALLEAISSFASHAAEKARTQGVLAQHVHVFAYTSPLRHDTPWHGTCTVDLGGYTQDTYAIVDAATRAARRMFQPHHPLYKAGVLLLDLQPQQQAQTADLFAPAPVHSRRLMQALDAINQRYGKNTIHLASCGLAAHDSAGWRMKQAMRSPLYTMKYEDLPIAHA